MIMTLGYATFRTPSLGHGAFRRGGPVVPRHQSAVLLVAPADRLAVLAELQRLPPAGLALAARAAGRVPGGGRAVRRAELRGRAVHSHASLLCRWLKRPHHYTRPAAFRQGSVKALIFPRRRCIVRIHRGRIAQLVRARH